MSPPSPIEAMQARGALQVSMMHASIMACLLLHEDYVWASLGNGMKVSRVAPDESKEHSSHDDGLRVGVKTEYALVTCGAPGITKLLEVKQIKAMPLACRMQRNLICLGHRL